MSVQVHDTEDRQSPPTTFKMKRSLSQIYRDLGPLVPPEEHFVMTRLRATTAEPEGLPDQLDGSDHPARSTWSDTASIASEASTSQKTQTAKDPKHVVSHPSKMIDYHLYLQAVEQDKDTWRRRNGLFLYDGMDCRPVSYRELLEPATLFSDNGGDQARLLICALPIADHDTTVRSRHYVVGFDCADRTLFARHFDWITEKTDDLWTVWGDGLTMYQLSVPELLLLLQSSFRDEVHVGIGVLSSSLYCMALCGDDDPGLEIVIVIVFCQWLLDFAEVIFEEQHGEMDLFKEQITHYAEELRMVLQRASFRAWFVGNGVRSAEGYKRKSEVNKYISDLYNYEKSVHDGSLAGRAWRAPGLETCDRLRREDRDLKRQRTESRLEALFTIPEAESSPRARAAEAFDAMRERSEASRQVFESTFRVDQPPRTPRTPSPRPLPSPSATARAGSPMSPGIVGPATEEYDEGSGVSEYDRIPLALLLRRAADLVDAQPELDTAANRGEFGRMLLALGVGIERARGEGVAPVGAMDYLNEDWSLAWGDQAPAVRRLLPSPALD